MIEGRATADGTRRRAANRPGYRRLGSTDLSVSPIGFGGYRVGRSDPAHRAALRLALQEGVNLIDTSSNYGLGDSERLVGEVLAEGLLPRDEVVVVTKIGYVQGPNLELAQQREAEGRPFPDMVKLGDDLWHCIHPAFLEDQLGRALERLGLETIDVLLLHNPEHFLTAAADPVEGLPLLQARAAFYERLGRACSYLDQVVQEGRIGAYGVSSNTCVLPSDRAEATSVVRLHEFSGGRLQVLQLPYNLLESGAVLEPNTPDGTALEAAARRDLGVLVNRPFNAAGPNNRLVRLVDPPRPNDPGSEQTLRTRLAELARLEQELSEAFQQPSPATASLLESRWEETRSPNGFAYFLRGELVPTAQRGLYELMTGVLMRPSPEQSAALRAYQEGLNALLERLQARAQLGDPGPVADLRSRLEAHLSPELRGEPLSRLALDFIISTPGVTCALVGMRHPAYVADALGALDLPPIPDVAAVARALRA
jgi:aryl-alcohol dehydrogenase-like predicted oxidoreductase